MKALRRFSYTILLVGLVTVSLLWQFQPSLGRALPALHVPANDVEQAWRLAEEVGVFDFRSEVEQTLYPAPRLNNVGRPPRIEYLTIAGEVDQPNESLAMTLWLPHQNPTRPEEGLQIKIENGQAQGRASGSPTWENMDQDISGLFAPGGDLLGFLSAAKNVQDPIRFS